MTPLTLDGTATSSQLCLVSPGEAKMQPLQRWGARPYSAPCPGKSPFVLENKTVSALILSPHCLPWTPPRPAKGKRHKGALVTPRQPVLPQAPCHGQHSDDWSSHRDETGKMMRWA